MWPLEKDFFSLKKNVFRATRSKTTPLPAAPNRARGIPLEKDTFFVYFKEGHGELWKINTQAILTKGCHLSRMHAQPSPKQGCVL